MKKNVTKKLCAVLMACFGAFAIHAQTDVTNQYLTNADFETSPTMTTVESSEPNNAVHSIAGWTGGETGGYRKLFTLPYDVPSTSLPNILAVGSPSNGSSVTDGNNYLLAVKSHWSDANNYIQQTVTLPMGAYSLTWDSYVSLTVNNANSHCGTIVDGTTNYLPLASAVNTWTNNKLNFNLTESKSVIIRFGYSKSANTGGGDSPVLFVDNVKLFFSSFKDALNSKIQEAQAVLVSGSPGYDYLNGIITNAQSIYDESGSTADAILGATADLDAAIAAYTELSLADLQVDGTTISGFNTDMLDYLYEIDPSAVLPNVSATITTTATTGGASVSYSQITAIPGIATVTLTAGNGATKVYSVNFVINLIAGWDGNGIGTTTDKPNDFGWACTSDITWLTADNSSDTYGYRYRDNLDVGARVITHPLNNSVFSFPVTLEAGKIYKFTCINSNMNNNAVSTMIGINTASDATGTMLGSQSQISVQWDAKMTFNFDFTATTTGTQYLVWQTTNGHDRNMIWDLILYEAGDAIAVTFNSNGGTAINTQYFEDAQKATQPADPTKDGYVFKGWFAASDFTGDEWDFETIVDTDITLHAKWVELVDVNFELNGGNGDFPTQTIEAGATATEPTEEPTKDGYIFKGWYAASDFSGDEWNFTTAVTTDMTLHAKWVELVDVSFELNGGSGDFPTQTIESGETATEPTEDPTKDGYVFKGWYAASDFTGDEWNFTTAVTTDMTLHAKWIELVDISFELNGGNGDFPTQTIESGATATEPTEDPTKDGFTFRGWFAANDFSGNEWSFATVVTADMTLHAKWEVNGSSGMNVIAEDILEVEYYTLSGVRVPEAVNNNIYIVKKTFVSGKTEIVKEVYTKK